MITSKTTWDELLGRRKHIIKDLHICSPQVRLRRLQALKNRSTWPKDKFAFVDTKIGKIYSNTHTQDELSFLKDGVTWAFKSEENWERFSKVISDDAWFLTNVSSIGFATVRHRLYHRWKSFERLVAYLDSLLMPFVK